MQTLRLSPVELSGASALPPYLKALARTAERGGDLMPGIGSLVRFFEFDSFTYWSATRSTELVEGKLYELSTHAFAWSLRYDKMAYTEIDPRVRVALTQSLPFTWDQSTWRSTTAEVDEFLDDAARFGIGSGVCIPIHDPSFGISRFDFDSTSQHVDSARLAEIQNAYGKLSIVGRFLHDLLVVAIRRSELRSRLFGMPLNEKECQCLARATSGLALRQIANELNIDVVTANMYFNSIRAKLGCLTTNEAVAYAIKSGLVPR